MSKKTSDKKKKGKFTQKFLDSIETNMQEQARDGEELTLEPEQIQKLDALIPKLHAAAERYFDVLKFHEIHALANIRSIVSDPQVSDTPAGILRKVIVLTGSYDNTFDPQYDDIDMDDHFGEKPTFIVTVHRFFENALKPIADYSRPWCYIHILESNTTTFQAGTDLDATIYRMDLLTNILGFRF